MTLLVFERKWQALPRFQRTRGILRLLALWVSRAYVDGFKGAHRDPLVGLGTAPLDDSVFRSATFEQLGETKLEAAVTTDICGKKAIALDGVFLAGEDEGSFVVTASAGEVRGLTSVAVAKGLVPSPPPPRPPLRTGLRWDGAIPPQKWMNFYTKVLSKFAASKGLSLTVRFEVAANEAIPQQKLEETKVALRELGLDDQVRTG
jgi:hypothetical protein